MKFIWSNPNDLFDQDIKMVCKIVKSITGL